MDVIVSLQTIYNFTAMVIVKKSGMKKNKKKVIPEVHILGDLHDVRNLVEAVNKKKTIVLFHDGEQDDFYLEIEGKIRQILQEDISRLEKDYRLIAFTFFPGRKKTEEVTGDKPDEEVPEKKEKKKKAEKKEEKDPPAKKEKKKKEKAK